MWSATFESIKFDCLNHVKCDFRSIWDWNSQRFDLGSNSIQTSHFTFAELNVLNAWIIVNYYDSFSETGKIDSEQS